MEQEPLEASSQSSMLPVLDLTIYHSLERNHMIQNSKIRRSLELWPKTPILDKVTTLRILYLRGQTRLTLRCKAIPRRISEWTSKAPVSHQAWVHQTSATTIMWILQCWSKTTRTPPNKFHQAQLRSWCSKRAIKTIRHTSSIRTNSKWHRRLVWVVLLTNRQDKWVDLEVFKASRTYTAKTITKQRFSRMISIPLLDLAWANSSSKWRRQRLKAATEEHKIKEVIRNSSIVAWTVGWSIQIRTSSLNRTRTQHLLTRSILIPAADRWFKGLTRWSQRLQNETSWQQMISQSKRLNTPSILHLRSKRSLQTNT